MPQNDKGEYVPAMTRAKFQCQRIEEIKYAGYENRKVILTPVIPQNSTGEPEDRSFWESTPSGEINLTISKEAVASKMFEPGKKYYVDFTPVE